MQKDVWFRAFFVVCVLSITVGFASCTPEGVDPPPPDGGPVDSGEPPSPPKPPAECAAPAYDPAQDPGNGGSDTTLDELDKEIFDILYRLSHLAQKCHAQLWGGKYELHKIPMYLVNYGSGVPGQSKGVRGFLINPPEVPSGATLVDSKRVMGLPKVYLYQAAKDKLPENGFVFRLPIGNSQYYAMAYSTGDDGLNPKTESFVALLVHEAFHRIQTVEEAWREPPGDQDTNGYPRTQADFALGLLEGRVLLAGYTQKIDASVALQQYLAIRSKRIEDDKSQRQHVRHFDNFQEWLEGTPTYVETHVMNALGMTYDSTREASIESRLTINERLAGAGLSSADFLEAYLARFYATGGAVAFLLDRLKDGGWKDAVRKGTTLFDYVKQRYSQLSSSELSKRLEDAKKAQSFDEINKIAASYAAIR